MSRIVTVSERKAREAARRRAAANLVMAEIREFGHLRGGRFFVFGSAAEDRMKYDSDFDVVVDFPSAGENPRPSNLSRRRVGGSICRPMFI